MSGDKRRAGKRRGGAQPRPGQDEARRGGAKPRPGSKPISTTPPPPPTSRPRAGALIEAGDIRDVALARRCETVGEKNALSPLAETPLGRARLLRIITEAQYRAGVQLDAVVQIWRIVQGLGPGRIRSIDGLRLTGPGGSGGGREWSRDEIAALNHRYARAFRALNGAGRAAQMTVNAVVMHGEPVTDMNLNALRVGLDALSDLFNRGGRHGHPNRVLVWTSGGRVGLDERFWEPPPEPVQPDSEVAGNRF